MQQQFHEPMRLQKWIGQMGLASRRQAEQWIREGRLSVDGKVVSELGTKLVPQNHSVELDGRPIGRETPPKVYWLFNKPDRCITSRKDDLGRATIFDTPRLQKLTFPVSPVGRLDYRTEGLLILSNDGDLVHRLMHPSYKVPRKYYALVTQRLSDLQLETIATGMTLPDGPVGGCEIRYLHKRKVNDRVDFWYELTVSEGRNRLVRRIFEAMDCEVKRLIRFGFGDLLMPETLEPGEYLQLNASQIRSLKEMTQLV